MMQKSCFHIYSNLYVDKRKLNFKRSKLVKNLGLAFKCVRRSLKTIPKDAGIPSTIALQTNAVPQITHPYPPSGGGGISSTI